MIQKMSMLSFFLKIIFFSITEDAENVCSDSLIKEIILRNIVSSFLYERFFNLVIKMIHTIYNKHFYLISYE